MRRGTRRNRAFDIMGDRFGSLIDPSHFGGKSSFSIKRRNQSLLQEAKTNDRKTTERKYIPNQAQPETSNRQAAVNMVKA
jgi:hypothetical protein